MSLGKFLDPKNDFAFKQIFGTEKNQDILIHFLNDMLNFIGEQKIQSVRFLKTNQDPEIAAKKQSTVDVLCQDQSGTQYIIEMQVAKTKGFEKRAQYYAAKTYSQQLNQSEQYHQLKEVIFLAITDYVMFPDKVAYKSDHIICDKETFEHDLKDFSFTFLELPKFKKSFDELETPIEKWTFFFKHAAETTEKDLESIGSSDLFLERAYKALNRYTWSDIELRTYEEAEKRERDAQAILEAAKDEGKAEGKAEGRAEGRAEGEAKARFDIAKNLLEQGLSVNAVMSATGLTVDSVEKLFKHIKKDQ